MFQAHTLGIMTLGLLQPPDWLLVPTVVHLGLHMQTPPEIGFGQKTRQLRTTPTATVQINTLQWTSSAMILYSSHMSVTLTIARKLNSLEARPVRCQLALTFFA